MNLPEDLGSKSLLFIPELSVIERQALQSKSAFALNVEVTFSDSLQDGSLGPQLTVIPAGVFEMGSNEQEFGHRSDEAPQHYQQMTEPFAIGSMPITADQFERYTSAVNWNWSWDLIRSEGNHPVINIRHGEAEDFCRWLSDETGYWYRLPSEAEWEYACRAGSSDAFAFGDSVSCKNVHFRAAFPYDEEKQGKRFILPKCAPIAKTVEVGQYPANAWGLHDVHGNVWEMTSSNYSKSLANISRHHPAPPKRRNKWITVRGGSWFDAAVFARSASRRPRLRDELDVNLGFRVVRELR